MILVIMVVLLILGGVGCGSGGDGVLIYWDGLWVVVVVVGYRW